MNPQLNASNLPPSSLVSMAFGFACSAHLNQKRKYTGEPYVAHCCAVAVIIAENATTNPTVLAAALLHDTVEDTYATLSDIKYHFGEEIAQLVSEVTDISKPSDGNRDIRKKLDRIHLSTASHLGATIKLADLIDNTSSIVKYDKNFARVYLEEKELTLNILKHGHKGLWNLAHKTLQEAKEQLKT